MIDVTRAARIVFACGRPGSGKSHFVKACLSADRPQRLIIFDPDGEYGALAHTVTSAQDFARIAQANRYAVAFVPSMLPDIAQEQFEYVCKVAFEIAAAGRPVTLAADELQQVTTPSKAPPWWAACVRRGRKYGMTVYGAAQRPAEIDKTIYSNATTIRTGGLLFADDQQVIARALGVPAADVAALSGHQWIMRDDSGTISRG